MLQLLRRFGRKGNCTNIGNPPCKKKELERITGISELRSVAAVAQMYWEIQEWKQQKF